MSKRELQSESLVQDKANPVSPTGGEPQGSLRRYLPTPFRAWMAFNVWVELSTIYGLVTRKSNVVELSPWFDRRSYYLENTAMGYMYMATLIVFVCARALMWYLPQDAMIMLYGAVVHVIEVIFFLVLINAKDDWGFDEVKGKNPGTEISIIMCFITFNGIMLPLRYFSLASKQQRGQIESSESKQRKKTA